MSVSKNSKAIFVEKNEGIADRQKKSMFGYAFPIALLILLSMLPTAFSLEPSYWSYWNRTPSKAMITLTIDDGLVNVHTFMLPILKSRNITATAYVVTDYVGTVPGRMTVGDLRDLQANGWEIGSHTLDHKHLIYLPFLQAINELRDSKRWLLSNGFDVHSVAYPYGDENPQIRRLAAMFYDVSRSISGSYVSFKSIPFDKCVIAVSLPADHNLTYKYIDRAIAEKSWLIFYFHNVYSNGTITDNGQSLNEIADYISQKVKAGQLEVVTVTKGYQKLGGRLRPDYLQDYTAEW